MSRLTDVELELYLNQHKNDLAAALKARKHDELLVGMLTEIISNLEDEVIKRGV
jgi:hypothetical protein